MSDAAALTAIRQAQRQSSRDAFAICADTAIATADEFEAGKLGNIDAGTALRMLALVFRSSAERGEGR